MFFKIFLKFGLDAWHKNDLLIAGQTDSFTYLRVLTTNDTANYSCSTRIIPPFNNIEYISEHSPLTVLCKYVSEDNIKVYGKGAITKVFILYVAFSQEYL